MEELSTPLCWHSPPLCHNRGVRGGTCTMYQLVLAGDGDTGKSSFLLYLCMNAFRGDIPSTLGMSPQHP